MTIFCIHSAQPNRFVQVTTKLRTWKLEKFSFNTVLQFEGIGFLFVFHWFLMCLIWLTEEVFIASATKLSSSPETFLMLVGYKTEWTRLENKLFYSLKTLDLKVKTLKRAIYTHGLLTDLLNRSRAYKKNNQELSWLCLDNIHIWPVTNNHRKSI